MILATVPKGHDGRVWALDYVRAPDRPIRMLTVPNVFSLFPNTLLVPEDALGK